MKKSKLLYFSFVLLALLLFSISGIAQRKITGVVEDAKTNSPLEGATITVKNSKTNTISKEGGRFEITVPNGKVSLVVTFVGYQAKTLTVAANETTVQVNLNESSNQLNDVVIVGVQVQSRRKTTSAISTVLAKDIQYLPSPSVDNLLQGRVAGLDVQISSGEPGVTPTVVVRGNSKLSTNISDNNVALAHALSGPLYVIDGVPTNPEDISNIFDATGTDFLAGININDIASVDVQKDAAATAAWGSRGANGVIYITTKKGIAKVPEFRVNIYGGTTQQPQLLQTSTGAAEREQKMNIINQYATPAQLASLPQLLTDSLNPYFNNATDWQGLFYRTGAIQNVDASMSASSENVNYRISANYYDEKGIIEAFGFKRYSMRGNFNFKISPKLNSQFIVAMSKSDRQRGMKYYGNSDENTPVSGSSQPSSFYRLTAFDSSNFTGLYSKLRNKNIDDYYSASLTLNYAIIPSLKYTFQGAANITSSGRDYFQPSNIDQIAALDPSTVQASYAESDKGTYATYFMSNTLNFIKSIEAGKHVHNFILTGSQQFNADVSNSSVVSGSNVPSNNIQVVSGIPQSDKDGYSNYAADALLSFSGQLQYDFDNKYLLYGSYRGDASSRFGANTKWGYFPAAGIGWIISDEKFMNKLKNVIPYLKIRASYGVSGDQPNDFYGPFNSYIVPGTYNSAAAIQPSYTNGLTKNNLTWSRTAQKDVGVDGQFFDNRLTVAVDFYEKLSKNDVYKFDLPFYVGYQSIDFNAHDLWINNKGVDITLGTKNLSRNSPLQWNMQITLSHNTNIIAKLPNNNRTFIQTDGYGIDRVYAVGQPLNEMFQLKYLGVYNNQSEIPFDPVTGQGLTYFKGNHKVVPGDPIWEDVNKIGDVWSDEDNGAAYGDRIPTGDPNPQFTGGWSNEFSYKNFSLSILSVFTWKRTIVNTFFQQQIAQVVGGYSSSINSFASSRLPDLSGLNYWTPQNAKSDPKYKADFPSINPLGPSYYQYIPFTSMFNQDGSYFKISTVTLSYQLPQSVIGKLKIKGIRVYTIGQNLMTLKNSNIPNPELVNQLGVYTGGLYPTPIRLTFGADVQF
jgi:TonB-linked SusC/RagA family outer membrane protein